MVNDRGLAIPSPRLPVSGDSGHAREFAADHMKGPQSCDKTKLARASAARHPTWAPLAQILKESAPYYFYYVKSL